MQLISTSNIGIRFLLSVINIFSKYASVIRLPEKKNRFTRTNTFQYILKASR